jgi:predicted TIM-barrel fold metal-dependent hydrolase
MNNRGNMMAAARHVSELAHQEADPLPFKPISADSHVTEPPNCYQDFIDPKYRDKAPYVQIGPNGGAVYVIEGMNDGKPYTIGYGGMSAAGIDPKEININGLRFEDAHKGGHDGAARIADQDRDGVGGEVIFPSVGMALCNHPDAEFKQACFSAYNRWLQQFQSAAPDRIFGLGQTAAISVKQTVADLETIKEMGFWGAMFPCEPAIEVEYDDPQFDPVWEAAVALQLPIAFHILTSRRGPKIRPDSPDARGRNMAHFHHTLIRANQDVISTFIWGRVFERFPGLRLVCAEADAGWVPHFMHRLDHFYHRHRFHQKVKDMTRLPSEQFSDNVYVTFQDDAVALNSLNMLNPRRLLWANDFPHSDSTWPWSQQLLMHQTKHMTHEERRWVLRDNVVELFNLPVN